MANGFETYRKTLAEAGAIDFDEQIYRSIEILLRDPDARSVVQGRCRHLLVDEFQDLNAAHMLLIRLLCAPAYSCFGVGDDDQVIYGYTGATPEYLIDFGDYFPGAHNYALEINYRCPPALVGAATSVLSYNVDRIAKTIRTPPDRNDDLHDFGPLLRGRGPVAVVRARSEELPTTALDAISGWLQGGVPPGGDRGADPGELVVAPDPDRAGRSRDPLQRSAGSEERWSERVSGPPSPISVWV